MSDISITVTADPAQALQGLEAVRKKADELAESQRKVQEASDAAATDSMNSISTVSREAMQTIAKTGDALSTISGGIRTAGTEAGKVAGALGKSIPVISQIGSAIATAITGPIGIISAAVGLAIAGIQKMITDTEERLKALKNALSSKSESRLDDIMSDKKEYEQALTTIARIREINELAKQAMQSSKGNIGLSASEMTELRRLAAQIGITSGISTAGISSKMLDRVEKAYKQTRAEVAEIDYNRYMTDTEKLFVSTLDGSNIPDRNKTALKNGNLEERYELLRTAVRNGWGQNTKEQQAYKELAEIIFNMYEAKQSYERDPLLIRSRDDLEKDMADKIKKNLEARIKKNKEAQAEDEAGQAEIAARQKERDKKDQAELDAEEERKRRVDKLIAGMDRQIQMNELIADGKEKEAFLLKNRLQAEDLNGKALTEAQIAEIDARSERLYALQHPEEPDLTPEDPGTPAARAARAQQGYTARLDRLQAVGANLRNPAVSPEKMVMDKQLTVQEEIKAILQTNFTASQQVGGAIFP